jgi:hypothetical protein
MLLFDYEFVMLPVDHPLLPVDHPLRIRNAST